MSRCPQVLSRLHRYLDGELQELHAHEVNLHVAHCAACAAELEKLRALHRCTEGSLRNEATPPEFDTAVLEAVQRLHDRGGRYGNGTLAGGARRITSGIIQAVRRPSLGRNWFLLGITSVALFAAGSYYRDWHNQQAGPQTVVLAQSTLPQGAPASLRVLTYQDGKQQAPLPDAPVSIQMRSNSGNWQQLYNGSTNEWGTVDARILVPNNLEGDCQLQVRTGGGSAGNVLTKPVWVANSRAKNAANSTGR